MANSIALAKQYLPLMDEVYKASSKTAVLDVNPNKVKFKGGNKVELFKTTLDGLGDYSRNGGYVSGSVTDTWEEKTLTKDRGRSFMVDSMDNEETLGMAFGTLVGEFIRTKVVPEVDAYRFATLSASAGNSANADIVAGTTDVAALIEAAEATMGDAEVPTEGRILFVSETAYRALKAKITRYLANENGVNREVEVFNGMPVIRVPQGRFNTAITLKDGTSSGQTAGGFVPTTGTGYAINFMIVHPSAVMQVIKHALPRIFTPEENQTADAYKFDYRIYHDEFVLDNKTAGIYLHRAATALS